MEITEQTKNKFWSHVIVTEDLHSKIDMYIEDALGREITPEESKIIGVAVRAALSGVRPSWWKDVEWLAQIRRKVPEPVADFTDKHNSSDKPWCCWINQKSGEECKNPARWDIRWPPFGYEDNTQSCDDHIFNLRGEGRNEITKIPEPVAPIRTEIQKMVDDMVNTPKGPRYVQRNIGDLMILEDMDKPVAAGKA